MLTVVLKAFSKARSLYGRLPLDEVGRIGRYMFLDEADGRRRRGRRARRRG